MRLLNVDPFGHLSLTDFPQSKIPPYAILSHTWGKDEDELTFEDICNESGRSKEGYAKILFCAQQCTIDGIGYFWVDTCCINKANHTELSEAIQSMFRWYAGAQKCYVYLSDVSSHKRDGDGNTQAVWENAFRTSRWFTRGWTLQELLAPKTLEFFSREGELLGRKATLDGLISEITGIPVAALRGAALADFKPEDKFRWEKKRVTGRIEDKAYCLLGIFEVFMVPQYGEGDHAFHRLKDEISRSYRRQLNNIGQDFMNSSSEQLMVTNTAPRAVVVEEVPSTDCLIGLFESLGFSQMDSRRATIKKADSSTCQWMLKHPVYKSWSDAERLSEHHGFMWISGKPGAGKSTLMKFAHADAERRSSKTNIVTSFFFNARGGELERSTVGMYRSLLYQLFKKAPDLKAVLNDLYSPSTGGDGPTWSLELLHELLFRTVARLGQRRLSCYIDALDECDEREVREMIVVFEELGSKAVEHGSELFICFSSRHYPTIDIRKGCKLILEHEQDHGRDLEQYVDNHLRAGSRKNADTVRTQILQKANGIFMWAVLVVDILNNQFRRGRIFAVQKRLNEIPTGLSNLFKDILKRDQIDMDDFLLAIQWILFARRPLSLEEFYFAVTTGLENETGDLKEWDPQEITSEHMISFLHDSSKGLAELTRSKTPTVQFIHESIRDFLVKDNGLRELWPDLEADIRSLSHNQLKRCCQRYLSIDLSDYLELDEECKQKANSTYAKDLRDRLAASFPFLEYASQNILYHANKAAQTIQQDGFLGSFALKPWLAITNALQRFETRRHTLNASLLYILAENGCARLIETSHDRYKHMLSIRGERYEWPFFAAIVNGDHNTIRAICSQNETCLTENTIAGLISKRAILTQENHTPLSRALQTGHKGLAEDMFMCFRRDLRGLLTGDELEMIAMTAATFGPEEMVEPIFRATRDNVEHLSFLLLCNRAILHAASMERSKSTDTVVKLLLERDSGYEVVSGWVDRGLLKSVIFAGLESNIRLLMEKRPQSKDSLLIYSVRVGYFYRAGRTLKLL